MPVRILSGHLDVKWKVHIGEYSGACWQYMSVDEKNNVNVAYEYRKIIDLGTGKQFWNSRDRYSRKRSNGMNSNSKLS